MTTVSHTPSAGMTGLTDLPGWARRVAGDVDLVALGEVVVRRDVQEAFPALADDAEFVARLRASVTENLQALRAVLCGHVALADVHLHEPLEFATVQARLHVPQTSLQRSYRIGFTTMWEVWSRRVRLAAEQADVPRAEALETLDRLTSLILAYQDHVASQVAETFARADDALSRSRAHVRAGLVRQLLRGDDAPLSPGDQLVLGYPLHAHHVAVLLPTLAQTAADRLAPRLRTAASAGELLVHPVDLVGSVVWLASQEGWSEQALGRVHALLEETGVRASTSAPRAGLAGLRATWQQVHEVEEVRDAWGVDRAPDLIRHGDVSLDVLLLRDPPRAREFVLEELGALAATTEQAHRLRQTLEVSFQLGSHVATAEHLHLHEHTVRNRLHKAEELLGKNPADRRTELQVALRLVRLVEDAQPPSATP